MSVFLHVQTEVLQFSVIQWNKQNTPVARLDKNSATSFRDYRNRAEILTNGTLLLKRTQETDQGMYSLVISDRNETIATEFTELFLFDVVSQPLVNYSCRHNKNVQFHCSVQNGDYLMFQWSLNGNTLDGKNASSRNKTAILALNEMVSGSLICIVGNNISKSQSEPLSFTCAGVFGGIIWFMIGGIGTTVLLIVIAVSVLHCCLQKPQSQPDVGKSE
ncbi:hypothetical protein HHUSO_G25540 [Huso huso]|uniref:Ig-like domain-containing protein n=1 Tax=Huso huso TaxID=61971 RepID=A0ABR0YPZ4_HUSHU